MAADFARAILKPIKALSVGASLIANVSHRRTGYHRDRFPSRIMSLRAKSILRPDSDPGYY